MGPTAVTRLRGSPSAGVTAQTRSGRTVGTADPVAAKRAAAKGARPQRMKFLSRIFRRAKIYTHCEHLFGEFGISYYAGERAYDGVRCRALPANIDIFIRDDATSHRPAAGIRRGR